MWPNACRKLFLEIHQITRVGSSNLPSSQQAKRLSVSPEEQRGEVLHLLYKETERLLKAYHGNEQEKPAGVPTNAWKHRAGQR